LAASLLLRIKSEILLNKHIREIDNLLFKREEEIEKVIERIDFDEIERLERKAKLCRVL
jgi:chromatin segregation and condensation protein Rec8/ScpA/Scc1 (kleisin family)